MSAWKRGDRAEARVAIRNQHPGAAAPSGGAEASVSGELDALGHDLGTPLTVIAGRAGLILREPLDERTLGHARAILEQCRKMTVRIERALARDGRTPDPGCRDYLGVHVTSVDTVPEPTAELHRPTNPSGRAPRAIRKGRTGA